MISVSDEIKLRAELARDLFLSIDKNTQYTMGNIEWSLWNSNKVVDNAIKHSLNIKATK